MKKAARNKKRTFFEAKKEEQEPKPMTEERKKRNLLSKPFIFSAIVILLLIIGAGGVYLYSIFQKDAQTGAVTDKQVQEIIQKVGRLVVLPEGETPTIATVTDVEKLSGQPFFRNAQNGDRVIIIGSTREAILYRPSIDKIITMAPINTADVSGQNATAAAQTNTQTPLGTVTPSPEAQKIRIAVLNSTKEAGLARKGANLFDKEKFEIVSTSNAQGEYKTTSVSVVNRSKVNATAGTSITSTLLKVKPVSQNIPADEAAPAGAVVVVILGSEFADAY